MTLDIAMGGSTNTVLHLLAAAHEAEVDFTMADIDRLSRRVPMLCKVAPSVADVHVEDVHRAGGIFGILGELDRAGLLHRDVSDGARAVARRTRLSRNDIKRRPATRPASSSPPRRAACRRRSPSARTRATRELDEDREKGVIRDVGHAYSKDGGLAVLYGNLARDGCIVKTAGVDESNLKFEGPAQVFDSQDDAVRGILNGGVAAGDVVVIRYEGPRGGPGMQEMLYPDLLPEVEGPRQGLRAHHRRPLLRRHLGPVDRPCLAGGGRGRRDRARRGGRPHPHRHPRAQDRARSSRTRSSPSAARRWRPRAQAAWKPEKPRKRQVSTALRAYAAFTTSAARGAVREVP